MYNVSRLDPTMVKAVSLVNTIVTVGDRQYSVHSVEGPTWYTFDNDGDVILDTQLTIAHWVTEPVATLIPMGYRTGDGRSVNAPLSRLKRGVTLSKQPAYAGTVTRSH